MKQTSSEDKILSIDIGGSHVKATILDNEGALLMDYEKIVTPPSPKPKQLIEVIQQLIKAFPVYDKVSVGFPGYVKNGVIFTAPNLGTDAWKGFDLAENLEQALGKPTKVVNDADMQGLGVVQGVGFEMVVTLGTGFGTAFLSDGYLLPHLEIAHHPITKSKTYDDYIGEKALEKEGEEKWNDRLKYIIGILKTVFNYDTLYIGGGNSRKIKFKLDDNIKIISNRDGIKGGARLWKQDKRENLITALKQNQ
ncbi:ROK family protein [Mucilaginibacter paludis]|uniref:ROK family protein n=1 Tax=Mucilaginibacter paludis DSM 18603 TaxID=714943 RepID=H1YDL8_9SPHI|nr:ROK family protein [Mucilaginibacter paludis]EHQ30707.1 ROK family protein [Mucilaginibacter paludis DSM 18603]